MYGLEGFSKNIQNVYRIVLPKLSIDDNNEPLTVHSLRAPYHEFIRGYNKIDHINSSDDVIVRDQKLVSQLLPRIGNSNLNDLDQEFMVGEGFTDAEFRARIERFSDALRSLQCMNPQLFELFHLVIHSVAVASSKLNRFQQRASAGSSSDLIGLIWVAVDKDQANNDLLEIFVHEMTHTLLFLDELNAGHFNYQFLSVVENFAHSAILRRSRPMDKVFHSIIVACEVLHARETFIGHPTAKMIHPPSREMCQHTRHAIDSMLSHKEVGKICTPRAIQLIEKAQSQLNQF